MRSQNILSFLHNLFLFIAFCGLVCSLYRANDCFVFTLTGAPVLLITLFFHGNKKTGIWVGLAALGAAITVTIIFWESVIGGVQLFANDIYDVAEDSQGYIYDRYNVSVDEAGYHHLRMITAILLSVVCAAAMSLIMSKKVRAIVVIVLFGFIVFLHTYYGIKPDIIWMLIFAAMMITTLADAFERGGRAFLHGSGLVLGSAAVIIALTFLAAPNDSAAVSELNEQLRDRFSQRTAFITNNKNPGESDKDSGSSDDEKKDDEDQKDKDEGGADGRNVNVMQIVVILSISAAAIVLTILFIRKRSILERKRKQNRKGIDSPDDTEAVHSMFIYMMRWLTAAGLSKENTSFSDCVDTLEKNMPEGYTNEYRTWFGMWQEATFGNKRFTREQRDLMKSFLDRTSEYLWNKASFKERYEYKYKFAL